MYLLFGLLVIDGYLVVAALQRHEALGWLGLEVKRDSLRGNFGQRVGRGLQAGRGSSHAYKPGGARCAGSMVGLGFRPGVNSDSQGQKVGLVSRWLRRGRGSGG